MRLRTENGFTLVELLVSISLFSLIALACLSFAISALRTVGVETRVAVASQELKSALQLMSTELRMSSSLSPYIVGNASSSVTCTGALSVTSTKVKFIVSQDENVSATSGLQPYYVGYWYDSTNKRLLRGEIPGTSITDCTPPSGDPTSSAYAYTLAENVVQIDADGDGTLDNAFSTSGSSIVVHLGVQIDSPQGLTVTQGIPATIYRRVA